MRKKNNSREIEIDEIFLDHMNAPGFHKENMEGMIENPIKRRVFWALGCFLFSALALFAFRVGFLQIMQGKVFYERSEKNYLRVVSLIPKRGIIYDRDGNVLAYNEYEDGKILRKYPSENFLHVLGYLNSSPSASDGNILTGADGLEAAYEDILKGVLAKKIEEVDANGSIISSGALENGEPGQSLLTSLSRDLENKLGSAISATMLERGFTGGAGVFIDVRSGEILALVSFPEFDPNLLNELAGKLLRDERKPFLNRAISGLYPPGSIVKPALAAAALAEHIITPDKKILSAGSIALPNPYDANRPNIFPDWKAHGWVDMRQALAVSSDVYFYEIGGGYQDQQGLGAWNIKKYLSLFGLGERAGIDLPGENAGHLPDPSEKQDGRDWTIGDTYHISIGQGNMVVTPIQMAVYAATIASGGVMPYPHLVRALIDQDKKPTQVFSYPPKKQIEISPGVFSVVKDGMREAVKSGTAAGLGWLPFPVAAKTGTAEIGEINKVHSWSIGFFPYDKPQVAFAILMESGPRQNTIGATFVASEVLRWIADTDFLKKMQNDILLTTNI
ncbi:hypothetical protein A3G55_03575 [Candidatus Giovannonibacteria bacterium RIFCSPLOWO2_12_FULL_44_25]|uniref:Penicillin-binding protein transpeptidase domain-containing protein n=2 Tax=Candidatus Giovannoniibacteriota TaxID=1752738 RepID=A0A1F5WCR1_9BACT|nr:MAG: Cell division protein ftsi/penicillin-binding protein 2 [Candidatus Giovannonibacteria bacterium GW2011_GWA1_44_25]KKU29622.1 MAG: Cell division protein ftsi/penicillin-binding protein 2 [Candidatus Giovannonibacteria bacterium GW2011_GWB1_46_20]OGF50332.1 MAG: hypothetical protein A2120_02045 [Candidatus Giovannonibacteria bacterium GWA2_45_15]OGF60138.1 MAG: hypothetical protein A2W40_00910 [Candidatus Giovannonibacteria bacterium RIFCSPHIGHO2_01_45_12]OGF60864.1 MAG: hypothetical pro